MDKIDKEKYLNVQYEYGNHQFEINDMDPGSELGCTVCKEYVYVPYRLPRLNTPWAQLNRKPALFVWYYENRNQKVMDRIYFAMQFFRESLDQDCKAL